MNNNDSARFEIFFKGGIDPTLANKRTVIALGTFDGVHIAHKALICEAVSLKERLCASLVGVWCFEESPAAIIHSSPSYSLSSTGEKIALLFENGADFVVMGRFEALRETEASEFIESILKKELRGVGTVCGYNHRFGYMGLGNPTLLDDSFGKDMTVIVPEIRLSGETVSSSAIRDHILHGEMEIANKMLGRAFSLTAPISKGKKLGRTIGFPTANQIFPKGFVPLKNGVYATRCSFGNSETYMGVSNVGVRPSIESGDDHRLNCETYIIDFSGEIYGKEMKIEFCSFLREEKKFSSLDELSRAIELDREHTVNFFSKDKKDNIK